jgi:hypothetical protein
MSANTWSMPNPDDAPPDDHVVTPEEEAIVRERARDGRRGRQDSPVPPRRSSRNCGVSCHDRASPGRHVPLHAALDVAPSARSTMCRIGGY